MLSFLPHGSGHTTGLYDDPSDPFGSQRSKGYGLMTSSSQPSFPFTGFPMHPSHDPMGITGKKN